LKVHLLVKAIDSLRIDGPSIPLEQDMHAPISIPDACLANVSDPQLQFSLLAAFRLVDIKRPVDLQNSTGPACGYVPVGPDLVDKRTLAGRL
jgi:hypothetical protein